MNKAYGYLNMKQAEQLRLLGRFVNQDSGSNDRTDVNRMGGLLARALKDAGLKVTKFPQTKYGDHLLAVKTRLG